MINGIVERVGDKLRLWVRSQNSGSTGGDVGTGATYSHTASLISYFTPDAVDMSAGMSLVLASSSSGSGSWSIVYTGPGAPLGYTISGAGYDADLKAEIRITSRQLYGTFYSKWRFVGSSIELWKDGSLQHTFSSIDIVTDAFGPSWIPLIGCFAVMSGSCSSARTGLPGTMPDEYEYWSQSVQTITGCWDDWLDGAWVAHPISLVSDAVPSAGGTCPFGLSLGHVTGSTQNGLSISAKHYSKIKKEFYRTDNVTECYNDYYDYATGEGDDPVFIKRCHGTLSPAYEHTWYKITTESESHGGSVWCIPNLDRTINRFNADFSELIQRLGLPKTMKTLSHSCTTGGVTNSVSNETEVHPRHTALLSTVGHSDHTIEDPLAEPVYAPMSESTSKSKTYSFSGYGTSFITCISDIGCPPTAWGYFDTFFDIPPTPIEDPDSESASCVFPSHVDAISDNSYLNCYVYHAEPIARYVNFLASPHWLYWPHFPEEKDPETDTLGANDWPVDSALVSTQEYWDAARTQWIYNTALPSGENRRTRNSLVSFCGYQSGYGAFFKTYVHGSVETSWLGVSRWVTQELDLPASLSYTLASEPLWTLTDCSGAYGTDLVLTPTAGTIKAKVDLGSWGNELFMYPHISHQVKVDWLTTNVTAVRCYLCSIDGTSRVLLENATGDGFTTRNVVYDKPHATDAKYSGSHAQDMGCLIVTDTGTDLKPTGISAATMADAERAMAFQLLGGGTAQYLEFEIDCTGAVTLHYPTFYASKSGWSLINENGHHQILLRANGPALRIGQLTWNSGNSLLTIPAFKDFPGKMSIVDWLCTRRALCGANPNTGVTTELSSLFDSYEGQSVQHASETCYAFLLPINEGGTIRAALVNTFSECPPIPHFPRKARSETTWEETGAYCLEDWEWAQEPRYLINGGSIPLHVLVGSSQWTAASALSISGYSITEHSHEVDNTEECQIMAGDQAIASSRPWWGWLFVYGIAATLSTPGLDMCVDPMGNYYVVYMGDEGLKLWRFSFVGMSDVLTISTDTDITKANIAWHPNGYLKVAYGKAGALYEIENWSYGDESKWSAAVSIGSGELGAYRIDKLTAIEYNIYHDGTSFKCRRCVPGGTWTGAGTILTADSAPCGLDIGPDAMHQLVAVIDDAGSKRRFVSVNHGDTWQEI